MAVTIEQIVDAINKVVGPETAAKAGPDYNKQLKEIQNVTAALNAQREIIESKSDSVKKQIEFNKISIELMKEEQREQIVLHKLGEITEEQMRQRIATLQVTIEKMEKSTESLEANTKALREQQAAMESIIGTMSNLISVYGQHNLINTKTIKSIAATIKKAGLLKAAVGAVMGIVSGFINTTIAFTLAVDTANSEIMKQTGLSRDNAKALTSNAQAMSFFGVTAKDLVSSVNELVPAFTNFTMLNKSEKRSIAETGALLAKTGVSAGDFAQGMQLATKAMGQSADAAAATQRDLGDFATIIGVTPKQMASEFAGASSSLAKFGSDGVRAFKDLAIVSKTTGLAMEKLLRITEKFDTFEGAAEQAGMLNAALGGNFVNAMDLMTETDPAGRFTMIRDAILDTGLSFDSMSYYQRKFYAQAAGLDDVNDLALLMSGNFDSLAGSQEKSSAEILKLQERTKAFQDIGEKFKTLLMSLIPIFEPLIDKLTSMADYLAKNRDTVVSFGKALTLIAGLLVGGAIIKNLGAFAMALFKFALGSKAAVPPALLSAKAFGLQALALLGVGAAIGVAAFGFSFLVASFKDLGENGLTAALGIYAVTRSLMTMATSAGSFGVMALPAMKTLGVITLAIVGVSLAIAELVTAFGEMFGMINSKSLDSLTKFFAVLTAGTLGLPLISLGLIGMVPSLFGISYAIDRMDVKKLEAVASLFKSLAHIQFENISGVAAEIEAVVNSINTADAINVHYVSDLMTARPAQQATTAAGQAKMPPIKVDPKVEVAVYIDGKQMNQEAVSVVNQHLFESAVGR
tara:strand:+ start:4048 stop:6456 length:2409 start_codon:yes stop_codon:yes gene_type:complete